MTLKRTKKPPFVLEVEVNPKYGVNSFMYSVNDHILVACDLSISLLDNNLNFRLFNCPFPDKNAQSFYQNKIHHMAFNANIQTLDGISFFCGDHITDGNMCHSLLDHLMRAWQAVKSGIKVDRFIFFSTTWNWAKELIAQVLPAEKIFYISDREPLRCEKLLFCSNSWSGHGFGFSRTGLKGTPLKHPACHGNKLFLNYLRLASWRLIDLKKIPASTIGTKIFISRKSTKRRFSNQLRIEKLFSRNGFAVVYLEDYEPPQQLTFFRNATHIAALHGAGLSNLIAARKGTRVLEIFGQDGMHAYQVISDSLDLDYNHVCAYRHTNIETDNKACIKSIRRSISKFA